MPLIVPVLKSRLPQLGTVVLCPLAGFRQISWEPLDCRSNSHPRARNRLASSL